MIELISQYVQWEHKPEDVYERIERAGRVCYKSEDNITAESAAQFVRKLIKRGHLSVLEHVSASLRFVTSRAMTHELVRHRLASYSQESTRYVNYMNKTIYVVKPEWMERATNDMRDVWEASIVNAVDAYRNLITQGLKPQDARGVLPLDLKTEIVMTANMREWIHVLALRTSTGAHPQMRQLMSSAQHLFQYEWPVIFPPPSSLGKG